MGINKALSAAERGKIPVNMSEKARVALVEGCSKPAKGFEEWVAAHTKSSTNIGEVFEGLSSKQRTQVRTPPVALWVFVTI